MDGSVQHFSKSLVDNTSNIMPNKQPTDAINDLTILVTITGRDIFLDWLMTDVSCHFLPRIIGLTCVLIPVVTESNASVAGVKNLIIVRFKLRCGSLRNKPTPCFIDMPAKNQRKLGKLIWFWTLQDKTKGFSCGKQIIARTEHQFVWWFLILDQTKSTNISLYTKCTLRTKPGAVTIKNIKMKALDKCAYLVPELRYLNI